MKWWGKLTGCSKRKRNQSCYGSMTKKCYLFEINRGNLLFFVTFARLKIIWYEIRKNTICNCTCVYHVLRFFSEKDHSKPVYAFGISASFTDTVVYFTDIQILDSAKVSKEGFLAHRELYSYQLKNYLEDNQLQQNSTCMIYFSENRKKLEKEATKILNKYKKNNRMTVSRIDSDKFRFTKPEE